MGMLGVLRPCREAVLEFVVEEFDMEIKSLTILWNMKLAISSRIKE